MVEAICFPKEHRFVKSTSANGGYVCKSCRAWISDAEFEKRVNLRSQSDGLWPLAYCEFCEAYHVPVRFWGTQPTLKAGEQ